MIRRQQVRPGSECPPIQTATEVTGAPVPDRVASVVENEIGVILKVQLGSGKAGRVRVPRRGPSTVVDNEVAVALHHSVCTGSCRPRIPESLTPLVEHQIPVTGLHDELVLAIWGHQGRARTELLARSEAAFARAGATAAGATATPPGATAAGDAAAGATAAGATPAGAASGAATAAGAAVPMSPTLNQRSDGPGVPKDSPVM